MSALAEEPADDRRRRLHVGLYEVMGLGSVGCNGTWPNGVSLKETCLFLQPGGMGLLICMVYRTTVGVEKISPESLSTFRQYEVSEQS